MKKTCDACGGTGQIGCFRGVSRFVISWDECFECNGTGEIEAPTSDQPQGKAGVEEVPGSPSPPKQGKQTK